MSFTIVGIYPIVAGLVAYTWREKKPSLNIRVTEQLQLVF
jgi:hypothetical protein